MTGTTPLSRHGWHVCSRCAGLRRPTPGLLGREAEMKEELAALCIEPDRVHRPVGQWSRKLMTAVVQRGGRPAHLSECRYMPAWERSP